MKHKWDVFVKTGITVFALFLAVRYWSSLEAMLCMFFAAALPLMIGCVIAYIVNILMSCYERHYFPTAKAAAVSRSRRPVCMLGAFITVVAVVFLVVWLIVPQLISCVQVIVAEVPGLVEDIIHFIEEYELLPENITDTLSGIDWRSKIGQIIQVLTSGIGSVVDVLITAVSSVFSGIVTGLLSVIFAIYLLSSKEVLAGQFQKLARRYLSSSLCNRINHHLRIINDCFHKYIVGQCMEAVIIGVLCTAGMIVIQLPYATMIGALVAFTALIPVAGAYIGAFVGAFMILTVSPVKALVFLVFIVVLQQVEGNIIYPRVVGSSMGLPGIWVLAAVTVGGGVLGIPGMLLGVPLAAAVYRLLSEAVNTPAQRVDAA